MSLLSSFKNDFNRTIEVFWNTETKSDTGFVTQSYWSIASWIKCLLLKNSNKYLEKVDDKVSIIQTSHKIRLDFWIDIQEDNKIVDNLWEIFIVKFVENCPWFWWSDDHLILYVDKQKWVE
jgi:hypothetical protein